MATIDVVPLHSEESPEESREEKAETSSENNDKARKRGRPAGAKDNKRRKTPIRRKKAPSSTEAVQEAPPIEAPPKIEPPVIEPAAPVIQPIVQQAAPKAVPEITSFQRHRMQYLERQSSRQAHWDGIVTPMFRFPVF